VRQRLGCRRRTSHGLMLPLQLAVRHFLLCSMEAPWKSRPLCHTPVRACRRAVGVLLPGPASTGPNVNASGSPSRSCCVLSTPPFAPWCPLPQSLMLALPAQQSTIRQRKACGNLSGLLYPIMLDNLHLARKCADLQGPALQACTPRAACSRRQQPLEHNAVRGHRVAERLMLLAGACAMPTATPHCWQTATATTVKAAFPGR
jgi:hypothetical protein